MLYLKRELKCKLPRFFPRRCFARVYIHGLILVSRWRDAIHTLAKFHRVSPKSVHMESFGRHSEFYDRQINLFKALSQAQAQTRDVDTKEPVGKIPYFDKMVEFFERKDTQPRDRSAFVHGDYKIDNLIFHSTEPRVIGILEYVIPKNLQRQTAALALTNLTAGK